MVMPDKMKADLFLLGVIAIFLIMTLFAFLLNEGKEICVLPFMRRYFPNTKYSKKKHGKEKKEKKSWNNNDNNITSCKKEKTYMMSEMNTIHESIELGETERKNVSVS